MHLNRTVSLYKKKKSRVSFIHIRSPSVLPTVYSSIAAFFSYNIAQQLAAKPAAAASTPRGSRQHGARHHVSSEGTEPAVRAQEAEMARTPVKKRNYSFDTCPGSNENYVFFTERV